MEFIKIIPPKAEKRGIRVSVHLKGRKHSPLRVREED